MIKINFIKLSIIVLGNLWFYQNSLSACSVESVVEAKLQTCENNVFPDLATIDALSFLPIEEGVLRVSGNVCLSMGKQTITTKELIYDEKQQQASIKNELIFNDGEQLIIAKNAEINMHSQQAELSGVKYKLKASGANGVAELLKTNKKISQLTGMTYSTCPTNDPQWFIKAESALLDQENQVGTFRKMTLRFKGVPILYFPYAKLPLNNQRKTGFLIPEISNSSNNGFDFALPYYINISENMDATLTPRYMTNRGAMLAAEFRYLGESYKGEIFANYLPSDKTEKTSRGYAEFKHKQSLGSNWSLNTNLKNVSDAQYFEDFGNNIYATSLSHLYSFLNIKGFGENWLFNGKINDFQIINDNISFNRRPYQSLPSLDYSWFSNSYTSTLSYGIDSNWESLYRQQSINVNRFDAVSYIEKTFLNSHSRFTPKLAYRYTNWDYSNTQYSTIAELKDSRSLPIITLDYAINFEKQFADGRYSSIEPRLFYLYTPYSNQQNIPLFDTHELTFGSGLLYQSNSFSGVDRQADANQISIGITQRHFDSTGNEKWNILLGQITYFDDRLVQLIDNPIETRRSSPLITEFNYFVRNWKATMSLHWDTRIDNSERALLKIQHKGKNNSLFNFAYRFRRGKIEQLDTSVVLPIGANNRFIARWNYSLDENKTIEAIAGFEYKSCCWATRLVARRFVFNADGDVNNGIFLELQLNGLGSLGRNPRRLLKQSILGYSEEF